MNKLGRVVFGAVLTGIGVVGLLGAFGLVDMSMWGLIGAIWGWFWRLLIPLIVLGIGIGLICRADYNNARARELHQKRSKERFKNAQEAEVVSDNEDADDDNEKYEEEHFNKEKGADGEEYWATFSGQEIDFSGKEFSDCRTEAVFGGIKLDLKGAKLVDEAVIKATSIFGGTKIYVPDDVKVEVSSSSVFGGVNNHHRVKDPNSKKLKTLYVDATCVFGGLEIF